jgi:hypothetical protein
MKTPPPGRWSTAFGAPDAVSELDTIGALVLFAPGAPSTVRRFSGPAALCVRVPARLQDRSHADPHSPELAGIAMGSSASLGRRDRQFSDPAWVGHCSSAPSGIPGPAQSSEALLADAELD